MTYLSPRFIFIVGGRDPISGFSALVQRYDLSTDIVKQLPDLSIARSYLTTCCIGDALYAIGGKGKDGCVNSIEKLDKPGGLMT